MADAARVQTQHTSDNQSIRSVLWNCLSDLVRLDRYMSLMVEHRCVCVYIPMGFSVALVAQDQGRPWVCRFCCISSSLCWSRRSCSCSFCCWLIGGKLLHTCNVLHCRPVVRGLLCMLLAYAWSLKMALSGPAANKIAANSPSRQSPSEIETSIATALHDLETNITDMRSALRPLQFVTAREVR